VQEGKCHKCAQWVVIETIKDVEMKVRRYCFGFWPVLTYTQLGRSRSFSGVLFCFLLCGKLLILRQVEARCGVPWGVGGGGGGGRVRGGRGV
jgi:hypothetical protein